MGGRRVRLGLRRATIFLIAAAPAISKSPLSLPKGRRVTRSRLVQVQRTVTVWYSRSIGRAERSTSDRKTSVPSSALRFEATLLAYQYAGLESWTASFCEY